ncbi:hypothetical protein CXG81DRAFT_17711 [Caulochytrium protostelioides]|uniref:Uncharacterized protein n=1 Tax=Caulochytrium protostelioides TaxID=1555241 RepID=A0A4P9XB88_9FUNG|nr:hypothetical protein CXG81DRAFT_17711 [Caulochytrium protostelioides]|eukprot:RKP02658.1 hypothetical protein CXG81DRAFT_17711 [Caulochytrium protostelioides]
MSLADPRVLPAGRRRHGRARHPHAHATAHGPRYRPPLRSAMAAPSWWAPSLSPTSSSAPASARAPRMWTPTRVGGMALLAAIVALVLPALLPSSSGVDASPMAPHFVSEAQLDPALRDAWAAFGDGSQTIQLADGATFPGGNIGVPSAARAQLSLKSVDESVAPAAAAAASAGQAPLVADLASSHQTGTSRSATATVTAVATATVTVVADATHMPALARTASADIDADEADRELTRLHMHHEAVPALKDAAQWPTTQAKADVTSPFTAQPWNMANDIADAEANAAVSAAATAAADISANTTANTSASTSADATADVTADPAVRDPWALYEDTSAGIDWANRLPGKGLFEVGCIRQVVTDRLNWDLQWRSLSSAMSAHACVASCLNMMTLPTDDSWTRPTSADEVFKSIDVDAINALFQTGVDPRITSTVAMIGPSMSTQYLECRCGHLQPLAHRSLGVCNVECGDGNRCGGLEGFLGHKKDWSLYQLQVQARSIPRRNPNPSVVPASTELGHAPENQSTREKLNMLWDAIRPENSVSRPDDDSTLRLAIVPSLNVAAEGPAAELAAAAPAADASPPASSSPTSSAILPMRLDLPAPASASASPSSAPAASPASTAPTSPTPAAIPATGAILGQTPSSRLSFFGSDGVSDVFDKLTTEVKKAKSLAPSVADLASPSSISSSSSSSASSGAASPSPSASSSPSDSSSSSSSSSSGHDASSSSSGSRESESSPSPSPSPSKSASPSSAAPTASATAVAIFPTFGDDGDDASFPTGGATGPVPPPLVRPPPASAGGDTLAPPGQLDLPDPSELGGPPPTASPAPPGKAKGGAPTSTNVGQRPTTYNNNSGGNRGWLPSLFDSFSAKLNDRRTVMAIVGAVMGIVVCCALMCWTVNSISRYRRRKRLQAIADEDDVYVDSTMLHQSTKATAAYNGAAYYESYDSHQSSSVVGVGPRHAQHNNGYTSYYQPEMAMMYTPSQVHTAAPPAKASPSIQHVPYYSPYGNTAGGSSHWGSPPVGNGGAMRPHPAATRGGGGLGGASGPVLWHGSPQHGGPAVRGVGTPGPAPAASVASRSTPTPQHSSPDMIPAYQRATTRITTTTTTTGVNAATPIVSTAPTSQSSASLYGGGGGGAPALASPPLLTEAASASASGVGAPPDFNPHHVGDVLNPSDAWAGETLAHASTYASGSDRPASLATSMNASQVGAPSHGHVTVGHAPRVASHVVSRTGVLGMDPAHMPPSSSQSDQSA